MSRRSESYTVKAIDTGFTVDNYDAEYNIRTRAFTTWDETLVWLKDNTPKIVELPARKGDTLDLD